MPIGDGTRRWIKDRLAIVNKDGKIVPFELNAAQSRYADLSTDRDIILKARKMGFSSLILARYFKDFVLEENSRSVVVADNRDNAVALLDRVKFYLKAYNHAKSEEEGKPFELPLRYNSKNELVNDVMNSRYFIGTAENAEFGRSQDITNLHLSEAAFYPKFNGLIASAMQAMTNNGRVVIETTANGFNEYKEYWDSTKIGDTNFKAIFFAASTLYSPEFLEAKRQEFNANPELQRKYRQEYPENDIEAFLTSGDPYFLGETLEYYLSNVVKPQAELLRYV